MKNASMVAAMVVVLAAAGMATPAAAYYHWNVHWHYGPHGHGCKVVRVARGGPHWHRWWVRRICR